MKLLYPRFIYMLFYYEQTFFFLPIHFQFNNISISVAEIRTFHVIFRDYMENKLT